MNIETAITVGLAIAGFAGGVIWKVSDLSIKFGRMTQKQDENNERDKEERKRTSEKFSELYNRTSAHDSTITGLINTVSSLANTCTRIESKLDRLIEKRGVVNE